MSPQSPAAYQYALNAICSGEDDLLSAFHCTPISLGEFLKRDPPSFPFGMTCDEILSTLHLTPSEKHSLLSDPAIFIMSHPPITSSSSQDSDVGESEVDNNSMDDGDGDFVPRRMAKNGTSNRIERNGKRKKKKIGGGGPCAEDGDNSDTLHGLTLDESVLLSIFDASRLELEKKDLEAGHVFLERKVRGRERPLSDIVKQLTTMIYDSNLITECQLFMPSEEQQTVTFSTKLASMVVNRLVDSVEIAPHVVNQMEKQRILCRAFQWQTCQSLLVVYRWFACHGPRLADHLILIYRHRGADELSKLCPSFGTLICHIAKYAQNIQDTRAQQTVKGSKRSLHRIVSKGESDDFSTVPADLFGILPTGKGKTTRLPSLGEVFGNGEERLFEKIHGCFLDLISRDVIFPKMRHLDTSINKESKAKMPSASDKGLKSRLIARGAILNSIVEAWGGDDICACWNLHKIVTSPMTIFRHSAARDFNKFSTVISNGGPTVLLPLRNWLQNHVSESVTVQENTSGIAELVHRGLLEIQHGRLITIDEFKDPGKLLFREAALHCSIKRSKRIPRPLNFGFGISDILHDPQGPKFIILNLILREAINERRSITERGSDNKPRQIPPGHPQLRWVLEGRTVVRGDVKFDRDHTDPIRADSIYSRNLRLQLPPSHLTTKNGLSNLLTFMGTGQSGPTLAFQKQGSMVFTSLDDAVRRFDSTLTANEQTKVKVKVSNGQVWGQPCTGLDLFHRKFYWSYTGWARTQAIREKLAPYWSKSVSDAWVMFLVDMLDCDPAKYNGPHRRTWRETLNFIYDLDVSPFHSGLTAFQMANNLAILGICHPPTPLEIVEWMDENRGLGAFRGLEQLGFTLSTLETIYAAFMIVYDHLDHFLIDRDRDILKFGAMLVEHILCKVVRWEDRVGTSRMAAICKEVLDHPDISVADVDDHVRCPFPAYATSERLEEVLTKVVADMNVSVVLLCVLSLNLCSAGIRNVGNDLLDKSSLYDTSEKYCCTVLIAL